MYTWCRQAGIVLLNLLLLCGYVQAESDQGFRTSWDDPRVVAAGEVLFSRAERPPPPDADWHPVMLPDNWAERPPMTEDTAWYRFTIDAQQTSMEPWGIYLWRYGMNARIYFNDDLLLDGGSFEVPVARNLHRPLLAQIPVSAWREGENHVYIHLRGYPNYGHLLPIGVGPYTAFTEAYADRFFLQIELSQYLFVVTLLIAILALVFWRVDRRNSAYGYFAGACLAWSIFSLNPFIQNLPFSNIAWLRLLHTSIDLFGFLLMMFLHRQLGHKARKFEFSVLGFVVLAALYYQTLPIQDITRVSTLVHLVTNLLAVYLLIFTLRTYIKTRNPEALLYFSMIIVLLSVSIHDLLLTSGAAEELWVTNFLAFNLGAPVVFVILIIYLSWRMGRENTYWEARVDEVTGQLVEEFKVRESLERDKAASDERERIYRDLHDDIGARLLSMVYRAQTPTQAEEARLALRELKEIVARSASGTLPLLEVVSDWEREVRSRLEDAGLRLDWESDIGSQDIGAEPAYQLTRILREVVSNVLKHAQAERVRCRVDAVADALTVMVADDGVGISSDGEGGGTGIVGIHHRIEELGGSAQWEAVEDGTTVIIRYHLNRGSN